jgi:trans-2,3-dihydro-3-hydroxyanthranilate isomerase
MMRIALAVQARPYNSPMPTLEYRVLDVFTDRPLAGNQLGLFPAAGSLDGETMQAIARELNLAESVFITGRRGAADYDARIFTPAQEMPFAGHPSIGCAWFLFRTAAAGLARLRLHLPGGEVVAELDGALTPALVAITPPPVTLGAMLDDVELAARLFGVAPADLALDLGPAQQISVGLRYLQVPLRDRGVLERCRPDVALLEQMDRERGFNQLACFCREAYTPDAFAAVRMFAPMHGVYEDPATGSNAACLAAYLRTHDLLGDSGESWVKLDQGYSIARPSALYIRANAQDDGSVAIRVGGQCVEVMQGVLAF